MKRIGLLGVLLLGLYFSCQTDDSNTIPNEVKVQDFVWKGLNLYYLWQEDVSDLSDTRFENQGALNGYLKNYPDPMILFDHLLYQKGVIDRFSVIYSDYTALEQTLTGTSKSHGVDYGLFRKDSGSDQVLGLVRYILPDSDASNKDIHRGDWFYAVNGITLTLQNYKSLLSQDSYTLQLADYDGGNFTPNDRNVSLTKNEYSENPVYKTQIYQIDNHKIGYLVYNGFYGAYEVQLNQAFAQFKSQGITDFVLDLRYNSGGLIATATRLASMLTGQYTGEVFAKQQWNAKVMEQFQNSGREEALINRFTDKLSNNTAINHLNLNKIYILTTSATASASELIINGLKPYIDVIQIGTKTTGKNVGSVTLYDSPDYSKVGINPQHKYAMQPLVLRTVNKDGFGEYQNGIEPQVIISENYDDMKPLGDIEESLLATAIAQITGAYRLSLPIDSSEFSEFTNVKSMRGVGMGMVVELP